MLKKCFIILPLLFCLLLSGCGFLYTTSIDDKDKSPRSIARDTRDCFVECVKANDTESISDMFCEATPVSAEEIDNLLDNIEGEIVSIETNGIHDGLKQSRDGVYTIYTYAAICTAYTDDGKEYKLSISGVTAWEGIPSRIGLDSITLADEQTDERYGVGLWKIG